jgi:hypothetical protein
MFIWTFVFHGHLKFTLPPHGLPLTLITQISAFSASNKTKEAILYFVITTILQHRRTVHASKDTVGQTLDEKLGIEK